MIQHKQEFDTGCSRAQPAHEHSGAADTAVSKFTVSVQYSVVVLQIPLFDALIPYHRKA